jgi:hypothetical protein
MDSFRIVTANLPLWSIIFVGVAVLANYARAWYRLKHIPGPIFCHFSLLWLARTIFSGNANEEFKRLIDKYGMLNLQ